MWRWFPVLIGAGLLAAVAVAASAGDRWVLPGILIAAAAAAAIGWWGRPAPGPVRAVASVALAAMVARTFAGYLVPDHRVLAAVLAVGVAAAAVAFGVGVPVPARRLVTGFLLVAAAGFVAIAIGVDPPQSPDAALASRPTGPLFPAVAVFGLFVVLGPDVPRRRALGRIAVAAAAACAVVAAAVHQLGVTRFALSDVPIRDALIAADAAVLGTMLDVVVVVATVPALVAALAAARDDIGSPGGLPHAAVAVLAGAAAAALAAVAGAVTCLLIASTVALVGGVFGVVNSSRSRSVHNLRTGNVPHMTSSLTFTHAPCPQPATPERVAEVLASPGFGTHFTDHMVTVRWSSEQGWHDATVGPYAPLTLDPATSVLHYGQAVFEGLKAYRQPDGSIAAFRPDMNAARFRRSSHRLAIPELPDELFLDSLKELIALDGRWVPTKQGETLYLRPFAISTEAGLGVNRPANQYLYSLIASPAGSYFASGVKPVKLWMSTEYARATPGGTGEAKCAGNYAASFLPQAGAVAEGCDQVVYLDAATHQYVEELGGMNLFFVFGSGPGAHLVTPELTGSLLPGVTRDSLITLAKDFGYTIEERKISAEEWEKAAVSGELTEVFACGTAAVITPVGSVKYAGGEFAISGGEPGEITMKLREELTGIQNGSRPDPHGWLYPLG